MTHPPQPDPSHTPSSTPPDDSPDRPIDRRTFLKHVGATVGAAALAPVVAACTDDAATFDAASPVTVAADDAAPSTSSTPPSTTAAPATTAPSTMSSSTMSPSTMSPSTTSPSTTSSSTASSSTATTTPPASGGLAVADGGELLVSFSYIPQVSGSRRVHDPYIAVWIENVDGGLVQTVALWFQQDGGGTRWLPDLSRWNTVDGSGLTIDTISSATRTPGDYTITWDGTDVDGAAVGSGDYFVVIEAAREHGPHSLVRHAVTLNAQAFDINLPSDTEIENVRLQLVA